MVGPTTRRGVPHCVVIVLAVVAGCGTVLNLRCDSVADRCFQVYGGVTRSVRTGVWALADATCGHGGFPACALEKLIVAPYFLLVDTPLSCVGDTLTLPVVLRETPRTGARAVTPLPSLPEVPPPTATKGPLPPDVLQR